MTSTNLKKEMAIVGIMLIPILYLILNWQALPEQLPTHWNVRGEIDDYGPKYMLPLLSIGIYFLMLFIPIIDPRKRNYDVFSATYYKLRLVVIFFLSAISIATMAKALGYNIELNKVIHMGITLLFAIIGNYMGSIRPNWFIGIRTPWTLENDEVWRRTHRLGGKLWFWGGLSAFVLTFFVKIENLGMLVLILVIPLAVIPVVYSYVLYKKLKRNQAENSQGETELQ